MKKRALAAEIRSRASALAVTLDSIGEVSFNGFLQNLSNTLRRQLFRRNAPLAARLRPEINSTPCSQDPAPATPLWTVRVDVDNVRERAPQ